MNTMEEDGFVLKNIEYKFVVNVGGKKSVINFPDEQWHDVAKIINELLISKGIDSTLTITDI
jgi:hypothetical protein